MVALILSTYFSWAVRANSVVGQKVSVLCLCEFVDQSSTDHNHYTTRRLIIVHHLLMNWTVITYLDYRVYRSCCQLRVTAYGLLVMLMYVDEHMTVMKKLLWNRHQS